ncbi:MAG: serine/threonine-protein kinase [Nannocystaceae bacterium]
MNDEITAPPPWQLADALVLAQVEATLLGEAAPVRLGRYRIERDLGAGGMGRLVLAFDPDLQRHVALKLVAPPLASSAEARRRIVAEARAMARLSEPHVAQVYEVGELDGQVFVAMEFVDGHDLRQWLAAAPRRWSQVLALFLQAGAGLAAAHDVGITHRDFKPENVMVDQHGRARVIDFGLAGAAADPRAEPAAGGVGLTRTGAFVGTPGYMPPEQWDGELVDARADQFAFCVALFEALVGARPFDAATPERLREALRGGPTPAWPRAVPRWILAPLLRGLQAEPAARWSDLRALLRALDPGRRRRRTTAVATMGAGAGLLALAAFAAHDPCRDAGAAISSAWDAQQRASVRAAARAADAGWGDRSGAAVVERPRRRDRGVVGGRAQRVPGRTRRRSCAHGRARMPRARRGAAARDHRRVPRTQRVAVARRGCARGAVARCPRLRRAAATDGVVGVDRCTRTDRRRAAPGRGRARRGLGPWRAGVAAHRARSRARGRGCGDPCGRAARARAVLGARAAARRSHRAGRGRARAGRAAVAPRPRAGAPRRRCRAGRGAGGRAGPRDLARAGALRRGRGSRARSPG